ncbi:MAG: GNAT family N-acetyltransferase [Candidatus Moranbacteria bacterium]|nr:GNAT family N-acetyltransferase [Candidatus Moranbacteria bacterium]
MRKFELDYSAGGGQSSGHIEVPRQETSAEQDIDPAETKNDQAKERLEKFLEQEDIFRSANGILIVDTEKLHSPEVAGALGKLYLGLTDGKGMMGSFRAVYKKFSDLEAVTLEEYEKHLLHGEPLRVRKIFEQQNKSNQELAREKLLNILEQGGYLEHKDGLSVIDLEKIRRDGLWSKISDMNLSAKGGINTQARRHSVFDLLRDLQVVSRADYEKSAEKSRVETKSLFNVPQSVDAAFDLEKIKNNDAYYLNFWDLYDSGNIPWERTIKTRNGSDINVRELYMATKIFRDFKAKRDAQGQLLVFDDKSQTYKKISNNWLKKNLRTMGAILSTKGIHKFLLEDGQELQKNGLLTNKDFASQTIGTSSEIKRKEFVSEGGVMQVMINNVVYYIGRNNFIHEGEKIPLKNIKVVILDSRTAGIVEMSDDKQRLRYTLSLLNDEEISKKRKSVEDRYDRPLSHKDVSSRSLVTKKEIDQRISAWRVTNDNPKRASETAEDYAERIATLADYKFISKITDDFIQNSGVAIHKELAWREQQWLASAAYRFGVQGRSDELFDFGKKYKTNGLKTFLSMEFGQEVGDKILSIGERFDQATADLIFAKYAELADFAQSSAEYLASQFESKDLKVAQQVAEHLLLRGKQLLVLCAEDKTITAQQVLEKLNSIKAEVEIFKTSFAAIKTSSGSFSLENIKTTKFKITNGEGLLSEKEILDRMQEIYAQNYAGFPEAFREKIKESLEKRLANPKTDFYCLYHQNKIAAFCSMLQQEDGTVHFANFNVAPEYAASQIGNAMMEASLDEVAKNFPIVAEAVPGLKITDTYLNKKGFKKTGEIEVAGVKLWQIRKEKTSDAA